MPRSAVATGAVDLVLRAAKIAEALVARERGQAFVPEAREIARAKVAGGVAAGHYRSPAHQDGA